MAPPLHLERCISRVYAYVSYRIGAGPDAEDVTSETFERALRYQDSFNSDRGDATSWLLGIARRVIADRALRVAPQGIPSEAVFEGHEARSLRAIELAAAMSALDERDRDIIALRFGADLTAKEIARALGLRTNTVEVALHRALARLRAELGDDASRGAAGYRAPTADTP